MENGLSYDFGIQIASGVVEGLIQAVAGAAAITGTVYALISASEELDNTVRKNQIAFGGYVNTMKAIEFSADKLASGKTIFETKDIMSGMKALQSAGLDARKNFDLINKAANAAGMSFTQMSDMVRSGNFKGLADAGIITDRTAISFQHAGMNAQMATKSVMSFIEQANKKGMFDNTVTSLSSILARFKEFGKQFILSILGDPKDPNGFMYNVKATLSSMADKFYHALEKIKVVGAAIGQVLLFAWHVVGDFIKRIWASVSSIFSISDKTFENFQQKMMSFQLWLEILRVKINSFFDDHKKQIQNVMKVLLILWGLNLFGKMILSGAEFLTSLGSIGGAISKLAPGLQVVAKLAWQFGAVLIGVAEGLITMLPSILAFLAEFLVPIALIGAAVFLVYHYWEYIVDALKWVGKLIYTLSPPLWIIVGAVKLIVNNWQKIVALVGSVFKFIGAVANLIKTYLVKQVQDFIAWMDKGVTSIVKWISSFTIVRIIIDAVKTAFEYIGKIWDKISKGFGKVLDWAKGSVDAGTEAVNQKTAELKSGGSTPVGSKSGSAGTPAAAPAKSSAAQKVSYTPDVTTTDNGSGAKTMNINSGAVQINVGKDSGLDEMKLAAMIKKILLELNQKGQLRQGQVG